MYNQFLLHYVWELAFYITLTLTALPLFLTKKMDPQSIPLDVRNGFYLPDDLRAYWWKRDIKRVNQELLKNEGMVYTRTFPDLFREVFFYKRQDEVLNQQTIRSEFMSFRQDLYEFAKSTDWSTYLFDFHNKVTDYRTVMPLPEFPLESMKELARNLDEYIRQYREMKMTVDIYKQIANQLFTFDFETLAKEKSHPLISMLSDLWKNLKHVTDLKQVKSKSVEKIPNQPANLSTYNKFVRRDVSDVIARQDELFAMINFFVDNMIVLKGYGYRSVQINLYSRGVYGLQIEVGGKIDVPQALQNLLNFSTCMLMFNPEFITNATGCFYTKQLMVKKLTSRQIDVYEERINDIIKFTPVMGSAAPNHFKARRGASQLMQMDQCVISKLFDQFSYVDKYGQLIDSLVKRRPNIVYSDTQPEWSELCAPLMVLGMNWPCQGVNRNWDQFERWKRMKAGDPQFPNVGQVMAFSLINMFSRLILRDNRLDVMVMKMMQFYKNSGKSPIPFYLRVFNTDVDEMFDRSVRQVPLYKSVTKELGLASSDNLVRNYGLISEIIDLDTDSHVAEAKYKVDLLKNIIAIKDIMQVFKSESKRHQRTELLREIALRGLMKVEGTVFFNMYLVKGREVAGQDKEKTLDRMIKRMFDNKINFETGKGAVLVELIKKRALKIILDKFTALDLIYLPAEQGGAAGGGDEGGDGGGGDEGKQTKIQPEKGGEFVPPLPKGQPVPLPAGEQQPPPPPPSEEMVVEDERPLPVPVRDEEPMAPEIQQTRKRPREKVDEDQETITRLLKQGKTKGLTEKELELLNEKLFGPEEEPPIKAKKRAKPQGEPVVKFDKPTKTVQIPKFMKADDTALLDEGVEELERLYDEERNKPTVFKAPKSTEVVKKKQKTKTEAPPVPEALKNLPINLKSLPTNRDLFGAKALPEREPMLEGHVRGPDIPMTAEEERVVIDTGELPQRVQELAKKLKKPAFVKKKQDEVVAITPEPTPTQAVELMEEVLPQPTVAPKVTVKTIPAESAFERELAEGEKASLKALQAIKKKKGKAEKRLVQKPKKKPTLEVPLPTAPLVSGAEMEEELTRDDFVESLLEGPSMEPVEIVLPTMQAKPPQQPQLPPPMPAGLLVPPTEPLPSMIEINPRLVRQQELNKKAQLRREAKKEKTRQKTVPAGESSLFEPDKTKAQQEEEEFVDRTLEGGPVDFEPTPPMEFETASPQAQPVATLPPPPIPAGLLAPPSQPPLSLSELNPDFVRQQQLNREIELRRQARKEAARKKTVINEGNLFEPDKTKAQREEEEFIDRSLDIAPPSFEPTPPMEFETATPQAAPQATPAPPIPTALLTPPTQPLLSIEDLNPEFTKAEKNKLERKLRREQKQQARRERVALSAVRGQAPLFEPDRTVAERQQDEFAQQELGVGFESMAPREITLPSFPPQQQQPPLPPTPRALLTPPKLGLPPTEVLLPDYISNEEAARQLALRDELLEGPVESMEPEDINLTPLTGATQLQRQVSTGFPAVPVALTRVPTSAPMTIEQLFPDYISPEQAAEDVITRRQLGVEEESMEPEVELDLRERSVTVEPQPRQKPPPLVVPQPTQPLPQLAELVGEDREMLPPGLQLVNVPQPTQPLPASGELFKPSPLVVPKPKQPLLTLERLFEDERKGKPRRVLPPEFQNFQRGRAIKKRMTDTISNQIQTTTTTSRRSKTEPRTGKQSLVNRFLKPRATSAPRPTAITTKQVLRRLGGGKAERLSLFASSSRPTTKTTKQILKQLGGERGQLQTPFATTSRPTNITTEQVLKRISRRKIEPPFATSSKPYMGDTQAALKKNKKKQKPVIQSPFTTSIRPYMRDGSELWKRLQNKRRRESAARIKALPSKTNKKSDRS